MKLEDTTKLEEQSQKKKRSKLKELMYGSILATSIYILTELAMATFNVPRMIETLIRKDELTAAYNARHLFFYELSHPDPELGIMTTSNLEIYAASEEGPLMIETDELGFRNKQGDKENAKIAVVGDSFSWGYGVDFEHSWPEILESKIKKRIANFSMGATAPWQYNMIIKKYPHFFEKRLVVYGIYSNDFRDNSPANPESYYQVNGFDAFAKPEPTIDDLVRLKQLSFLERTAIATFLRMIGDEADTENNWKRRENYIDGNWLEDDGWIEMYATFDEFLFLAGKHKFRPCVVLFPSRISTYKEEYNHAFGDTVPVDEEEDAYRKTKAYFEAKGIPVLNLTPTTRAHADDGKRLYFKNDAHFNNEGNRIAAQEIYSFIMGHNLLGKD